MVGIYKITNPKNKIYIGQSTNIEKRFKDDYRNLKCKGQTKLYNSLKKYGYDNHIFEIIQECGINELDNLEFKYKKEIIESYGWKNVLFLMLIDGKGGNKNQTTKSKMSLSSTKINNNIIAYNLKGELIGKFNSASEAKQILFPDIKESTGGILSSCRNGRQKTHRGYIFQFQNNNNIQNILNNLNNNIKIKQKKILQYKLDGTFIREYDNSYQVEKHYKEQNIRMNSTDIRACCNKKQKTAFGYKWEYGSNLVENNISISQEKLEVRKKEYEICKQEYEKDNLIKSNLKKIILTFIQSNYNGEIIIKYNNEIDIFLPKINLGINILKLKDQIGNKSSTLKKQKIHYEEKNIKIINIFSDEVINKLKIVKSRILNELKLPKQIIYARKCIIKEILDPKIKNKFLNSNHIQGADKSKLKLGLYDNNELVAIMTFGSPRKAIGKNKADIDNSWELIRFCNKINTHIIGSASKLLKYFINLHHPKHIYSFADNRWSHSINNVYSVLGFTKTSENKGYWYTKDFKSRLHRYNFNKYELKKQGYDITKTEKQIMNELGYFPIWDCGTTRFELYV